MIGVQFNMLKEISENEEQIIQVLRQMVPRDQMLITYKSKKSSTEFEIRTGQVKYLMRNDGGVVE